MKIMLIRQVFSLATVASLVSWAVAFGDDVRYYEKEGVTYREIRQTIQRRVPEVTYEERPQTVLREQCVTEMKDTVRTYMTPVTEYQVQERLVGRWNPLVRPYFEYRNVPTVRWEYRSEVVKTPTARRELVPETRVTRTPVTSWRTVEEEVISRVAVGTTRSVNTAVASTPNGSPQSVLAGPLVPVQVPESARRDQIGGLSRLDSDPPRQGSGTAWRSADDQIRR
jgi:hypothetical protein